MSKKLFPLAVASGIAFCNRDSEQAKLIANINESAHTVLIAPRRYGKTSLSRKVAERWGNSKRRQITIRTSLLSVSNPTMVAEKIVEAAGKAVTQMLPLINTEELKKLAASLNSLDIEVGMNADGVRLKFAGARELDTQPSTILSIGKILSKLDEVARERGWKVMFEIDEFQEVSRLKESHAIEAEIRDAIQQAESLVCVFLGSNRQILTAMFTDKARPFYNMCHLMKLMRIDAVHYQMHLESAAKGQWGKQLSADVIEGILNCTERHPYFVNKLCSILWRLDRVPAINDVVMVWQDIVEENVALASTMLTHLSVAQKAVVYQLAKEPTGALGSKRFLDRADLAASTIHRAKEQLEKDDMIYKCEKGLWRIMDPSLTTFLRSQ